MPRLAGRDDAISDVIGTALLLAVTVALVVATAAFLRPSMGGADGITPRIDLTASASPGSSTVSLLHRGGDTWPESDLRVVILVNGQKRHDAILGPVSANWEPGARRLVTLSGPALPAGAHVEVSLVSVLRATTISEAAFRVPDPPGTPTPASGFTLTVQFSNGASTTRLHPPAFLNLRAIVAHPDGRKAVRDVTVDLSPVDGPRGLVMRDDGTSGDAVAGDGVFAVSFLTRSNFTIGPRTLTVTATDMGGARISATAVVDIVDTTQTYNTALLSGVGHRIIKYAAPSGSGDRVTIHFKVRMRSDPVTLSDGTSWTLSRAYLDFDAFKPGNQQPIELNSGASSSQVGWTCHNTVGNVKLFKGENITLPMYEGTRDVLRYYLKLEWKRTSGNDLFVDTVDSSSVDQYFLLNRWETAKVIKDETWPSKIDDCSA